MRRTGARPHRRHDATRPVKGAPRPRPPRSLHAYFAWTESQGARAARVNARRIRPAPRSSGFESGSGRQEASRLGSLLHSYWRGRGGSPLTWRLPKRCHSCQYLPFSQGCAGRHRKQKTPPELRELRGRIIRTGGELGIRTPDALLGHTRLAGEHLRPLGQLSVTAVL